MGYYNEKDEYIDIDERLRTGYYFKIGEELENAKPSSLASLKAEAKLDVENNFRGTLKEIQEEIVKRQKKAEAAYNRYWNKVEKRKDELEEEFKEDMFTYHNVIDNPKAETLYGLLKSRTDSYTELFEEFEEFVKIIEE
jgi:hypothetical protein